MDTLVQAFEAIGMTVEFTADCRQLLPPAETKKPRPFLTGVSFEVSE